MININLLPWRENLRRRRRRRKFLGVGLLLGLFLGAVGVGNWVVESKLEFLQREMNERRSSLQVVKREGRELDIVLGWQEKVLGVFQQQQEWRDGFGCHQRWLRDLGARLPLECLVEKINVNSGRWKLGVLCREDFAMKNLIHAVSSLPGLSQVGVRQLEGEEKLGLFRVEFNAVIGCR